MRDTRRQQRQGLNPLAFDGFKGLLPGFGGVVQNEGDSGAPGSLTIEWRGIKPEKTWARIGDLELMANNTRATCIVEPGDFLPIKLGNVVSDGLAFNVRLQTKETCHSLVEVKNAAFLVHNQHPIFNGVEDHFQEAPLAGQTLDNGLQTFVVEPPDSAQNLV